MDHLAAPREADPGLIEEEELANISHPSSNSSALDHASGTLDDIPGNEDVDRLRPSTNTTIFGPK